MNSKNKQHMNGLTRKDIHTFLTSKVELTKHQIEKKSLDSSFDAEALEGFATQNGSIADLKKLDKKFLPKKNILTWSISLFIGVIAIGSFFFFNSEEPSSPKSMVASNNITEITELVLPDSVASLIHQPNSQLVQLEKIKPQIKQTKVHKVEQQVNDKKEFVPIATIPVLKPDFQNKEMIQAKIIGKEIYFHDFKLIDYRSYRSKPTIEVEGINLSGTPADMEKQLSNQDEEQKLSLSIPYHDYIKKTMFYLKHANFKQVVARCNTILTIYPDDVNAQFYAGIAYYNLGEFQKSIQLFIQCINAPMSNFQEEAEWMLASSYEKNGESNKAKAIYQVIKQNGGYYSHQVPK